MRSADLCLYVGTSGNVWPAAELVATARLNGARCVLVNAEPWDVPRDDFHDTVIGPAELLLPKMLCPEARMFEYDDTDFDVWYDAAR